MASPIIVSVLVAAYNQEKFLAKCLDSILAQTYPHLEVIVVDDGSRDATREIMEAYAQKDVRVIPIHKANAGRSAAIATAFDHSQGAIIAFLDSDDQMLPTRLERQVAFLQAHPEVGGVSSSCHYIDEHDRVIGTLRYHNLASAAVCRAAFAAQEFIMCAITGLTLRREVFAASGGLRTAFWPCDDLELVNRIFQEGHILVNQSEVLTQYRIHGSSTTTNSQWHMFEMSDYTYHCLAQRWRQVPDIDFDTYKKMLPQTWWQVWRWRAHKRSIILLRQANFALTSRDFVKGGRYALLALLLDPAYVLVRTRMRWGQKADVPDKADVADVAIS